MRLGILLVIFRKEMLDTLRDRRTLISMVVVPLLIIPLMMTLMAKVIQQAGRRAEQEATSAGIPISGLQQYLDAVRKAGLTSKPVEDLKAAVLAKTVPVAMEVSKSPTGETEVQVYVDRSNEVSGAAADKLRTALTELKDETVRKKLQESGVPADILNPFQIRRVNIAGERKMAGVLWGRVLGYVVILLMFTGGMYPAIDMTAGEKERRTLETLLSSPASRYEIVLAKILACVMANVVTAVLTLASLAFSIKRGGMAGSSRDLQQMLGSIPLDANSLGLLLLTLLPVAVFAASTMIAIAIFARSFKEGQSYLTPLVLAVILPASLGGMSGLELSPMLALIPVFNASQLIRGIMLADFSGQLFLLTMAANLVYAAIAFWIAVRLFEDESVLFRS